MKAVLREPLLHFLALGALLFLYFEWRAGSGPGSSRIVITQGVVQNLTAGFTRTWRRPPTPDELKGLVDEYVKEEIATREATAMGLDRDDAVVRRRLRQKLEFLIEGDEQARPTDAELEQWLKAHQDAFPAAPQVALRQVFVSASRRGAATAGEAERLLARLRAAGREARVEAFGDPSLLPRELALAPVSEVARTFGDAFAAQLADVPEGTWSGPIESAYGLHVVLVTQRRAPPPPALAEVRPQVEREVLAERRRARLEALYAGLLEKYSVEVEAPPERDGARPAAVGTGGGKPR